MMALRIDRMIARSEACNIWPYSERCAVLCRYHRSSNPAFRAYGYIDRSVQPLYRRNICSRCLPVPGFLANTKTPLAIVRRRSTSATHALTAEFSPDVKFDLSRMMLTAPNPHDGRAGTLHTFAILPLARPRPGHICPPDETTFPAESMPRGGWLTATLALQWPSVSFLAHRAGPFFWITTCKALALEAKSHTEFALELSMVKQMFGAEGPLEFSLLWTGATQPPLEMLPGALLKPREH